MNAILEDHQEVMFHDFKTAIQEQFETMANDNLFVVSIEKEVLWNTYLDSFPEGTNDIFRERRKYDCQCCRQFIRLCGNVVSVVDNDLISIWDVNVGGYYQVVADTLSSLVKSKYITDSFIHYEGKAGTDHNRQLLDSGDIIRWDHFYLDLPGKLVVNKDAIQTKLGNIRSSKEVFKRALEEISVDAIDTVLELIDQKSIYRGEENKQAVDLLLKHKKAYDLLVGDAKKDAYCWNTSISLGGASRVRNSSIGTLLVDISDGVDLDKAVKSFESKVAPENYKRPTALISKAMIQKAQEEVETLGIESALHRRYATIDDITINNILFADRSAKKAMNVFEELCENVPANTGNLSKVDEVDIDTFINDILPKAETIEVMVENSHIGNLMSLIAPVHAESKNILKWDNNFSWSYNGEVADSIKERVKNAGGNVDAELRCSLSWFNYDDLDIHAKMPNGEHIFYNNKNSRSTSCNLDVDMNAGGGESRQAVENIVWTNKALMPEGDYEIIINNFQRRETSNVGFIVEIEFNNKIHEFHYPKMVTNDVPVATINYSKSDGFRIVKSIQSTQTSKQVWGIGTHKYHKVSMIMSSPNHWDDNATGNKHWFFVIDKCKNDKPARGFYNEFLNNDLMQHRKVFEVLGSKMKTEVSDDQLSGIGFSSTQRNHVYCKVTGSFTRTIKVNF